MNDERDRDESSERVYVGVSRGRHRDARLVAGLGMRGRAFRLWFGIVIAFLGALWTFDNLGWTTAGEVLRWWPVLLVAFGLAKLTGMGSRRHVTVGLFFLVVGLLLVAARLANLPVGLGIIFPLLLVFAGVNLVRRTARGEPIRVEGESRDEVIRLAAVMGSASNRRIGSDVKRASLSAVLGAVELDLREARPATGRIEVEAFACFGGIEIVIPETWRVEVESDLVPIAGAFEDRTRRPEGTPVATLAVRGTAIMGAVTVRNEPSEDREVHIVRRRRRDRGDYVQEVHVSAAGVKVSTSREPAGTPPPPVEPS